MLCGVIFCRRRSTCLLTATVLKKRKEQRHSSVQVGSRMPSYVKKNNQVGLLCVTSTKNNDNTNITSTFKIISHYSMSWFNDVGDNKNDA